ncbi:hypothetical protein COT65_01845 [Candidatus Shapirobacteria bacterium CG09_land_8_20_14_0_10_47_13]|uniref:Uncharacterized protein n=1 Tax=Candidatus Shapirobacteria bacterium CG09_land_8_20_14_0_10_47_13 TaxID=1974481 RepID=A0A2H0WMK5_9BACT|nr:MAG: hypothetical protein COT65_01845 [Candidatus Shapirobacteria bacterium CG09_land_8_20_14_0_10_47_13]
METPPSIGLRQYKRYFVDIGRIYRANKKVRVYTEIILSLVAISFFLVFAIKPTLVTITELITTIKDQRLVVDQLQKKITALGAAQSEYNLISGDLYLVDEALPKESQTAALVKQIEVVASQSGAALGSVKFDPVVLKEIATGPKEISKIADQTAKEINFTLTVAGDYPNLKEFLYRLNNLRRVITVETFSLKIKKAESQTLTLGVSGQAYYLSANEEQL